MKIQKQYSLTTWNLNVYSLDMIIWLSSKRNQFFLFCFVFFFFFQSDLTLKSDFAFPSRKPTRLTNHFVRLRHFHTNCSIHLRKILFSTESEMNISPRNTRNVNCANKLSSKIADLELWYNVQVKAIYYLKHDCNQSDVFVLLTVSHLIRQRMHSINIWLASQLLIVFELN